MERKIVARLLEWKDSAERRPLILQGARQIGKTYSVLHFAGTAYRNSVYCNFEKEKDLASLFGDLSPKSIIAKLSALRRQQILPGQTLVIFDEVQSCPEALTSLKYFCEEANEYHVIAMGSLLGVSVNRGENSFPVGKVQFMDMYPMDFEEYLLAKGEDFLLGRIRECHEAASPMEEALHEKALALYREYTFIGGMPAVVSDYVKNGNAQLASIIQSDILEAYLADMGKYNKKSEVSKTRLVYRNISTQLSKENRKFQYRYIKSGGRASEFEDAIEWVCLAGIARRVFRLEQVKLPLQANSSGCDFKFYMSDTGLCCRMQDLLLDDILYDNPLLHDFKGGLTENYVCSQLAASGLRLYYWTSGNQAEVDFVTRLGQDIIPIEVKSASHTQSRSLASYAASYRPAYCIRISAKNFGFENGIKSIPLYAAFCIKGGDREK
ncbi:MAG: ATP-binding protein [Spirochaetales bacterium]|nr:ATP-binding protein [Spirochaetales bacterium]